MLFHRTKNNKICQKIWTFIDCEKCLTDTEKIAEYCYQNQWILIDAVKTASKKLVYKTAEAAGEIIANKITE